MKNNPQSNRIARPYRLSVKEYQLVRANTPTSNADWEKSIFKDLKANIKNYYSIEQKDHCPYCRLSINYKGWDDPIEHIIHKEHRPIWMFEPLNLVLSCRHCNTKKSTKHALRRPFRNGTKMPTTSDQYRIIHPHFENFGDYIYIEEQLFCRSKRRDKGLLHILFFKLNEEVILIKRAKLLKLDNSSYYKKLTHKMYDQTTSKWEKRHFRKLAKEIIDRRPLS